MDNTEAILARIQVLIHNNLISVHGYIPLNLRLLQNNQHQEESTQRERPTVRLLLLK